MTLSNLTVVDGAINEQPCSVNTRVVDVVLAGSRDDTC